MFFSPMPSTEIRTKSFVKSLFYAQRTLKRMFPLKSQTRLLIRPPYLLYSLMNVRNQNIVILTVTRYNLLFNCKEMNEKYAQ